MARYAPQDISLCHILLYIVLILLQKNFSVKTVGLNDEIGSKLEFINKDFVSADRIREELKEKGIIIKDTRDGTTYEIVK